MFIITPANAELASTESLELNLPADVELPVLIDFVSRRLKINIIYDNSVKNKKITVIAPKKIPLESLLNLLESSLKASGFVLVETDHPGWMTIVPDKDVLNESAALKTDGVNSELSLTSPITQIYTLNHISVEDAQKITKTFLHKPGGNCFAIESCNALVITDRRARVEQIVKLLDMADIPLPQTTIKMIPVRYNDAEVLAKQVMDILNQSMRIQNGNKKSNVILQADKRSNQIIVIAHEDAVNHAIALINQLDVQEFTPPSPVKIYKLVNTTAAEVLATIKSLDIPEYASNIVISSTPEMPAQAEPPAATPENQTNTNDTAEATSDRPAPKTQSVEENSSAAAKSRRKKTETASVTADINTNSIIVIGPPAMQAIYEKLITMLDKRRPQVMIEVTMVSMDTSDNFSLGVEVGGFDTENALQKLVFSSFGLSEIDLTDGKLTPTSGLGFNGSILDTGDYSVVMRALQVNGHSEVLSAPKVLVNDNATASFSSVSEAPYTSVNASDTVATTSFAGYAEAGTTVTVTPHISEGDHLQLKYSVSLNSFSGEGTEDVPPPRQTNEIDSEVTIPDGHAIIIGGLNRKDKSSTNSTIPWLGKIPLLGYLLGNKTDTESESTLFVFIRPVILRDDQFEDLKKISAKDIADTGMNTIGTNLSTPRTSSDSVGRVMLME